MNCSVYCIAARVRKSTRGKLYEMQGMRTCVKRIFAELLRQLHEVTFDKLDLILQVSILGVSAGAANLEVVVV